MMCQTKEKEPLSDYDRSITKSWEKKSNRRYNQVPSSANNPNKGYLISRSFRKRMKQLQSLWLKPGSQKLSCKGKKKPQVTKGQAENHLYSGNLLCGQSWLTGYQRECVSCINGTWNILQRIILCSLLALKIAISIKDGRRMDRTWKSAGSIPSRFSRQVPPQCIVHVSVSSLISIL